MKKVKFTSVKNFVKGKGFLAALALSITAIGVSTYVAYNKTIEKITGVDGESSLVAVDNNQSGVPKDTSSQTSDEQANNFVKSTEPFVMPIDGEVLNAFSNNELVKSKTLGVWKTHDGTDIAAAAGTEVKAMKSGKVLEVRKDTLWGICVIVDHFDGYEGHYYGLSDVVNVKAQQEIAAGAVIGTVGNTAEVESAEESHLHFGLKLNGNWIDPVSVMSKNN